MVEEKLLLAPGLLQGKKRVDDLFDGTYQGQSNPVAKSTFAKGNGGVILRHQGVCDTKEAGRVGLVTLDPGELRS